MDELGYNNGACYCGSMVEQHIRNVQVEGSIPSSSSNKEDFHCLQWKSSFSGNARQRGNTCFLGGKGSPQVRSQKYW